MFTNRASVILSFAVAVLFLGACGSEPETASNAATPQVKRAEQEAQKANDNAEELAALVKLPYEPVEAAWRETPDGMIAVVRFSSENAARITSSAAKLKEPVAAAIEVEEWFPTELTAKRDLSSDTTLSGKVYSAEDILQPPYTSGRLVHLDETDYFVLDLKKN
ncbi:MAG: hypothetical protein KF855_16115 [Acidobacteria bacterium]|nr:hypothetical protein [Acidobacteriota bacterium]